MRNLLTNNKNNNNNDDDNGNDDADKYIITGIASPYEQLQQWEFKSPIFGSDRIKDFTGSLAA